MTENIIIDIAFRNICFLRFLNQSYMNLIMLQYNYKESDLKSEFIKANEAYLLAYQNDENLAGIDKTNVISKKKEVIMNWALSKKLIKKKNISVQDIHNFVDKVIIPELIEKLNDKSDQNILIFELLYEQVINNLCFSLNSLILLKNIFNKEKIEEMDKYTELLKKNVKEWEESKEEKKKLKNKNTNLTNQIISLNNNIIELKEKNSYLEGIVANAESDDFKFNDLKNQIMYFKKNEEILLTRINTLELELERITKENKTTQILIEEYKQIIEDNKADKKKTQILLDNYEKEKNKTNKIIEEDKKITASIIENYQNIISNYEKLIKKKDNENEELKNTVEKYQLENLNLICTVENYKNNKNNIDITKNNRNGTKSNGV